ncbi:hypothetical protein Bca52824_055449 [Brassica carinata]|uniref:Uncharacterized protein n=1 Tax=Brassica carinata TaxID=52824 RepID=A0A8X7RFA6_BRACI|nr:hypothetical protein Bca52824_055449 [Brassica carinata]
MAITGHPGAYLHVEELIENGTKLRVADFVHGKDGLGNQNFPPPEEIVSEAFTDLSSRIRYMGLMSPNNLEGNLEELNLELPSQVGVYSLELMQFISGKNIKGSSSELQSNVMPWDEVLLEDNEAESLTGILARGKSEDILGEAARVSGRFISSKEQFKGSNTICLNVTF